LDGSVHGCWLPRFARLSIESLGPSPDPPVGIHAGGNERFVVLLGFGRFWCSVGSIDLSTRHSAGSSGLGVAQVRRSGYSTGSFDLGARSSAGSSDLGVLPVRSTLAYGT